MRASPLALRRRQAGRWRQGFAAAVLLAAVAYAANLVLAEIDSGNGWGLAYGIAAAALLVLGSVYGLRRRTMARATRHGLGSARSWLLAHLYGGLLFLLFMLMHSGFALPDGLLTWALWLLAWWTVASGLAGLALQRWLPRALGSGLGTEVLYERIPELVAEIRDKAERLAARCSEPVQALYGERVAPTLETAKRRPIYFLDITGGKQAHLKEFDYLAKLLPDVERRKLRRLAELYKTKMQIDAHYTLQGALRWWLWLHVPTSFVLLLLLALHVFAVLYY